MRNLSNGQEIIIPESTREFLVTRELDLASKNTSELIPFSKFLTLKQRMLNPYLSQHPDIIHVKDGIGFQGCLRFYHTWDSVPKYRNTQLHIMRLIV